MELHGEKAIGALAQLFVAAYVIIFIPNLVIKACCVTVWLALRNLVLLKCV